MVTGTQFQTDVKYAPIKQVGSGAYGVVWYVMELMIQVFYSERIILWRSTATNQETEKKVAIKKITRAFEDLIDAKRILREIKLLSHFRHENVSFP